jgi:paired amphipathic helix protein Sin3a
MLMYQLAARKVVAVQLLGKEDLTVDDAVTAQEKWRQYIDSYALVRPQGIAIR